RSSAILFAVFLLVTPYFRPWYVVGLLALAVAMRPGWLQRFTLAFSATNLFTVAGVAGSFVQDLLRYGLPALLARFGLRERAEDGGLDVSPVEQPAGTDQGELLAGDHL